MKTKQMIRYVLSFVIGYSLGAVGLVFVGAGSVLGLGLGYGLGLFGLNGLGRKLKLKGCLSLKGFVIGYGIVLGLNGLGLVLGYRSGIGFKFGFSVLSFVLGLIIGLIEKKVRK